MDLGNLYFDIVSDFVLRISDFAILGIFTTVESSLQNKLFMQNKANFRKSQMNVSKVLTKDYEKKTLGQRGKTKPIKANQSQLKPIKANSKPIKANKMPKQTQLVLRSLWRSRNKPNFEGKKILLPGQSAPQPSCGNGCQDKICNTLIDLALHCW